MVSDAQVAELFRDHYRCDDPYYSCPQSGENPQARPTWGCDCGADDDNDVLADVVAELLLLREEQRQRLFAQHAAFYRYARGRTVEKPS